uniref:Secreted protein n=1 Tax=Macrostomum lignano TaxID=282301 RepID=A0A1I8FPS2_9PLAT
MAQPRLQTLLFAAHSYSALRAGRAELGSGGGLPGQRPPVRELQAVLLGLLPAINASNRYGQCY